LEAELAAARAEQRVADLQAQLADARSSQPAGPAAPVPPGYRHPTAGPATFIGNGPSAYADPRDPDHPRSGRSSAPGADRRGSGPENPLAAPPRRVPLAFIAAAFGWRWWEAWAFFMIGVAPIALWILIPWTAPVVWTATLLVAIGLRVRTDWANVRLLRRGTVAEDVRLREDRTGTYYRGVTYQNVRMSVAHGWQVTRQWYSGPGTKSVLDFTVDGRPGSITLHGLPYEDGVILADPNDPGRAKCVSQFPYDLDRDPSGNWIGAVPTRVWVGSFFTLALWSGWALLTLWFTLAVVG
jgi:hypothetical protein